MSCILRFMRNATKADTTNALNAVKNQPPITLRTPATLYTALSAPQARSAKELPIATINVTYVVDKGSLYEVAIEIKTAATIKLTAALTKSNAGRSSFLTFRVFVCGCSN